MWGNAKQGNCKITSFIVVWIIQHLLQVVVLNQMRLMSRKYLTSPTLLYWSQKRENRNKPFFLVNNEAFLVLPRKYELRCQLMHNLDKLNDNVCTDSYNNNKTPLDRISHRTHPNMHNKPEKFYVVHEVTINVE